MVYDNGKQMSLSGCGCECMNECVCAGVCVCVQVSVFIEVFDIGLETQSERKLRHSSL